MKLLVFGNNCKHFEIIMNNVKMFAPKSQSTNYPSQIKQAYQTHYKCCYPTSDVTLSDSSHNYRVRLPRELVNTPEGGRAPGTQQGRRWSGGIPLGRPGN